MNYQDRYLAHQKRKGDTLSKLLKQRHSTRIFADKPIEGDKLLELVNLDFLPSSCDRHGTYIRLISDRDSKSLLGGLLVGGVGWVHRAPTVLLIFADPEAYVENLLYMPYLDAGVVLYHLLIMAEALGLKACYINPQVRSENVMHFQNKFGYDIFCGAVVLGYE